MKSIKRRIHKVIVSGFVLLWLCCPSVLHAGEVEVYLKKGEALYQTHHLAPDRIDEAIGLFEKALCLRPDDYYILWKLSDMHENYGEIVPENQKKRRLDLWDKGAEYGRRAVKVNPNGKEGHFYYMANMGAGARERGTWSALLKFREIKKEMDRTLELDPNYALVLVARAQYLTEMPKVFGGDEAEAVRLYKRALDSNPRFIVAYYYMAQIDARHGRYDEALEKLDKVFQCENPWNQGHYVKIVLPWAERLRAEIQAERDK